MVGPTVLVLDHELGSVIDLCNDVDTAATGRGHFGVAIEVRLTSIARQRVGLRGQKWGVKSDASPTHSSVSLPDSNLAIVTAEV